MSTKSSDYFPDCDSCAFQDSEHTICEECEDADQWEPADTDDSFAPGGYYSQQVVKFVKRPKKEKMAA